MIRIKHTVILIIIITFYNCASNIRKVKLPTNTYQITLDKDFEQEKLIGHHSDIIYFSNKQNQKIFISTGKYLEVNVNAEDYINNDIWNDFIVADTIVLEGIHNGLYWKQIKFKKERYWPSIGYEGVPKGKVPEFENYLKTFTCKKK
ncbi:hypothetical protein [Moheibacter sediminis]|uniref:Uncharacterized protein n=1 Tax=Moheibacter sediminis TaxID=1434700 RepID=A0A1W2D6J5_9FLAO|nr:hypothetical protein [Moheibacter sediminis]SMC92668.1 hypothetical protein SAMN06296427_1202 [Moheibacter sediminis]